MKILRITGNLYPSLVGGLEIHAHEMSKFQAKLGHDVTVYTSNLDGSPMEEDVDGYHVVRFNNMFHFFGNAISLEFLPPLYQHWDEFDLVHAHSHLFFTTNLSAGVKQVKKRPLVITCHGIASASVPDWFNHLFMQSVGRWTLNSADRIICYTEHEKQTLAHTYHIPPEKFAIIPNGINTDLFCPNGAQSADSHTILMVGRFVHGKGAKYLIEAAHQLIGEYPDLRIVLVGWGPLQNEIRDMAARLGLNGNLHIIDRVAYADMPAIHRSADVYVLPSFHEGVPKSMLEAMACEKPVIISEFPHLRDLVEDAGVMVPKGESGSLADAIRQVFDDMHLARTLGENGRKKVLKSHSWENVVNSTVQVYREVLDSD